jgi:hypothetical protein
MCGMPAGRELKPTAKFRCRYAANMQLQRPINSHVHGFPPHGTVPHIPHRRVATVDFAVGFNPRTTVMPLFPSGPMRAGHPCSQARRVATPDFSRGFLTHGLQRPRITPPSRQRRLN